MSWLRDHLNQFVTPYLGDEPGPPRLTPHFTPQEMAVIKNVWRAAKAEAGLRRMLLAGRDVFIFEILARRERFPTTFRPDVSRQTAFAIAEEFRSKANDYFLLDTGFRGSIPQALGIKNYKFTSADLDLKAKQAFPHLTGSRSLALKIEATPKYWRSAVMSGAEKVQVLSDLAEFRRAAELTIQVYRDSSPSFVPGRRPIGGGRRC